MTMRCQVRGAGTAGGARRWMALAACLCLLAVSLWGCDETQMAPAEAKLSIDEEAIEFTRAYVGFKATAEVVVRNGGRAPSTFSVATSLPFSVRPSGTQEIGGTTEVTLEVGFHPGRVGEHTGALQVELGETPLTIPLRGLALAAPPCVGSPCTRATFDPERGTCLLEPLPNGARCEAGNACLIETTCMDGACVGAPLECVAPDMCTRAQCNPATGCEIIPWNDCPAPADPCMRARCDGERGCVTERAPDLTPCGALTCTERNLCVAGVCKVFTEIEEGTPCTHACGSGGECKDEVCTREDGPLLESSWSVEGGPSSEEPASISFPGVVDASGALHWVECDPATCALVSTSANGFERYRVSIGLMGSAALDELLVSGPAAIAYGATDIIAVETLEGAWLWRAATRQLLERWVGPEAEVGSLLHLVDLDGEVLAALIAGEGWWGVGALQASDGEPLWFHAYEAEPPEALLADGTGTVYFTIQLEEERLLHARGRDGDVVWEVPLPHGGTPLAAVAGRIFLEEGGVLVARLSKDGSEDWARAHTILDLVGTPRAGFAVEQVGAAKRLVVLDWTGGGEKGVYDLAGALNLSPLTLFSGDRVALLLERGGERAGWWLEEIDVDGDPSYACALPDPDPITDRWTFVPAADGKPPRLVLPYGPGEVRTFLAPRVGPASTGWAAKAGSLQRGGRPR